LQIRNRLSSWRDRIPSAWDDTLHWSDVLTWRHHVYGVLNRNFGSGLGFAPSLSASGVGVVTAANMSSALGTEMDPAVTSNLGYHELAWSLCTYARACRKQGLVSNALESLARVYQLPNVQLEDAFLKLKNQLKCYLRLPQLYADGISVISGTATEHFSVQQRAEWNVLAGQLHAAQALQQKSSTEHFSELANRAFSTASADVKTMSKCWIHWGHLYDQRLTNCTEEEKQTRGDYLFSCYLQAVVIDPVRAHRFFPRLLVHLLNDSNGANQAMWEKYASSIPAWLLFDHLPALFISYMMKPNSSAWYQSIVLATSANPLAVFQYLRAYLAGLTDCRKIAQRSSPSLASALSTAIGGLEQILSSLQNRSEVVSSEKVFSALERGMAPANDDVGVLCASLASVVRSLEAEQLQRASGGVPANVKATLADLSARYPNDVSELSKLAAAKTTKAAALLAKVMTALASANQRRAAADAEVAKNMSNCLIETMDQSFELVGRSMQNELAEDVWNNSTTVRFLSRVDVVNGNFFVHLCAATGVVHRFVVRRAASPIDVLRECRLRKFRRDLNEFLQRHEATARLRLRFDNPFCILVGNRVDLIECSDVSSISQMDVLEQHWQKVGQSPSALFQALLGGESTAQLVPENVLSEYVARKALFNDASALFCFKEVFAKELSLQCALTHLLRIPDSQLGPENFHIRTPSGGIFQSNLFNEYVVDGSHGVSLAVEEQPQRHMRNTPSIRYLIGPVHNHAVATRFHAFQRVISESRLQIRSCLELFARDDLVCWALDRGVDVSASYPSLVASRVAAVFAEAQICQDVSTVQTLLNSDESSTASFMKFF
jgi:hypothetical protein